jgi:hypothetical protein|nr:MAG TPA: NTP-PPase-like protein [Caudoviricetes sp.]
MKTIQELVPLIQEWAKERKIYEELTPFDELLKTHEEVGELIKACYDNDKPAIKDAIGDVLVTLINYCYMVEEDVNHIIKHALTTTPDTKSPPVRLAIFSEMVLADLLRYECKQGFKLSHISPYSNTLYIIKNLISIALLKSTTLEESLNIAYNEIKNRKGKMINGKFVKDE